MPNYDYRQASEAERLTGIFPGDPLGDFFRNPAALALALPDIRHLERMEAEGVEVGPVTTDVFDAADRLAEVMAPTPLEPAPALAAELGVRAWYKREDTTSVKSFKLRGAYNKMAQLPPAERHRGVLAASAGNHAQGVAASAQWLDIKATIVMPETTPDIKVEAVRKLGAQVVLAGNSYSEAFDYSQTLKREGKVFIHPFDDPDVIAGQATVALEILEQNPHVTHIFVPVGGGGLVSGVAQFVKAVRPEVKVIGVQSVDSDAMKQSLTVGEVVTLEHVGTFSDGTAVKTVGELTFALTQRLVDDMLCVTNAQVAAAMEIFFNDTRSILEPAGALSIAGAEVYARSGQLDNTAEVACVCSGANVPFRKLQFMAELNEIGSNHEALFAIKLPERSGALLDLCRDVVDGHNITAFNYRLQNRGEAHILVGFSTSDEADKQGFMDKLTEYGYRSLDLSNDDTTQQHIRHMIGGQGNIVHNERLYEVQFPERPGALTHFLEKLGHRWNISLFHYRGLGGDTGSVLIGLEDPDIKALEALFEATTVDFQPIDSKAVTLFLQTEADALT